MSINILRHIDDKVCIYKSFIDDNDLTSKLLDVNNVQARYTLDIYFKILFLFEKCGASYDIFYAILSIGYDFGSHNTNYPKKTSLNNFKNKVADVQLGLLIHTKHIDDENKLLNTTSLSLDSSFVKNDNCQELVGRSAYFKNRNGFKISNMVDQAGYSLYVSIDGGNKHDSVLGINLINSITNVDLNGIYLLADSGYDQTNFKEACKNINTRCLTTKNSRKEDNAEIKRIKKEEHEKKVLERKRLMNEQKKERSKHIRYVRRQKAKIKRTKDKEEIEYLDDLIAKNKLTMNNNINNIKRTREGLNKKCKGEIMLRIKELKERNRKECKCDYICDKCEICKTDTICSVCKVCKSCKKNMKYYLGMTESEIKLYKRRIKVENTFSHLKHGRVARIMDRKAKVYLESIYCRIIDLDIFDKKRNQANHVQPL